VSDRVKIESPYTPQWNGETGRIVDVCAGTYTEDGAPCRIATVRLDRIAAAVQFTTDELIEL
jgi:hypothetical protein